MAIPILFPMSAVPRKTHPLIKCIIDNEAEIFRKLIRGRDINGLYPSEIWRDDVTPLSAAVLCRNEEICSFLLGESADPNILSTNGLTPLHHAALTTGVPLSIVKRLLEAKADPDGLQNITPLQYAAERDREDIVKTLIEAGASPEMGYGRNPKLDKKVEKIIFRLSSQSQVFKKVHLFFSLNCSLNKLNVVRSKKETEVFTIYKEHFFQENPFIHTILLEEYFCHTSQSQEQCRQSAFKWFKDSKSEDKYIEGVIKRFPRIPHKHCGLPLNCLFVALRVSENISARVFSDLVAILPESLQCSGSARVEKINLLIQSILIDMMKKTSEQKLGLNLSVYETLYKSLLRFSEHDYSSQIRVRTYGLFAYIYDFAPKVVTLPCVPEMILTTAKIEMDELLEKKLQKLDESLRHSAGSSAVDSLCEETAALSTSSKKKKKKKKKKKIQQEVGSQESEGKEEQFPDTVVTSIEETNSSVQPFTLKNTNIPRRWHQISLRWRSKFEKLVNIDASKTYKLGNLTLSRDPEFLIANGSDGTLVFLGLRDDGTEVAVKRMDTFHYQVLKNEEEFLRLPELESPSIVRYVDFAEDDNFGYLVLQLCEYTLEEYIQDHLPDDSTERSLVLKKLVKEVLDSLQVLHDKNTKVLHRDIKPQNVLIDIKGHAKLADFGISRRLKQGETTVQTRIAGTKCWKAKENINEKVNTGYKRSSDIQVTGMLVYYILSGGHHPFGDDVECEYNISRGKYSLDLLDDVVAKDLIEWMINENPNDRPTVEQTLAHPFFWTDDRRVQYLKILGNEKEAANCRDADEELLNAVAKYSEGKSFSEWKTKLPSELVQKLDGKKKAYPENTLGLLRFIRNLHEHYKPDAVKINLMALFPDLLGSMYIFAKERGWNSRESVRMEIKLAS